jgi:excisionase family DNA binding protein
MSGRWGVGPPLRAIQGVRIIERPNHMSGPGGASGHDPLAELGSLRLLTPGEVAALLHVDANTVARWSNEGRLRAIRTPGGHRRYPASEVLRLVRDNHTGPDPQDGLGSGPGPG